MACTSRLGDGGACFDIAQRLPYPMPPHVCHVQQPVAVRFVRCAVAARLGDGRHRRLRGGERPVILHVFNFFRATGISEICFSNLLCGTLYPLWYTVSFMVHCILYGTLSHHHHQKRLHPAENLERTYGNLITARHPLPCSPHHQALSFACPLAAPTPAPVKTRTSGSNRRP